MVYYNEHDPFAAAWLRELIAAYQRSPLPRPGYTYERAMSLPHLATALKHMEPHRKTRSNDTMYCSCGKSWDMNDPYPPEGCMK